MLNDFSSPNDNFFIVNRHENGDISENRPHKCAKTAYMYAPNNNRPPKHAMSTPSYYRLAFVDNTVG
jgi:hypothetical protein